MSKNVGICQQRYVLQGCEQENRVKVASTQYITLLE